MAITTNKERWPFRRRWQNVGLTVVLAVVCIYLLNIVAQGLVKPGSGGQTNITTGEVESGVRRAATARGAHVSNVNCNEVAQNRWRCAIRLANGQIASGSAQWRGSGHSLGVAVQLENH